jgi:hypothetical protein
MKLLRVKLGFAMALAVLAAPAWSAAPECPEGFFDTGAACTKPAAYGRGAGYAWKSGDSLSDKEMLSRCLKDHPGGCEMYGTLAYPKCSPGFKATGCCICSPQCPPIFKDKGKTCLKPSPPA